MKYWNTRMFIFMVVFHKTNRNHRTHPFEANANFMGSHLLTQRLKDLSISRATSRDAHENALGCVILHTAEVHSAQILRTKPQEDGSNFLQVIGDVSGVNQLPNQLVEIRLSCAGDLKFK